MFRLLHSPFDEINALQQAIADKVENVNPGYAKLHDNKFFVGFEGRCDRPVRLPAAPPSLVPFSFS